MKHVNVVASLVSSSPHLAARLDIPQSSVERSRARCITRERWGHGERACAKLESHVDVETDFVLQGALCFKEIEEKKICCSSKIQPAEATVEAYGQGSGERHRNRKHKPHTKVVLVGRYVEARGPAVSS